MKVVFFSDAHLADDDPDRTRATILAIRNLSREADMVVVLGDLFEFYHGFGTYIYPFYEEVINALRELARKKQVYFVEGNHEFGMGQFFESYTGVKCVDRLAINIDGKKVFLSHGDELGSPILRTILKSRVIYSVMDFLGPRLTWRIAMACRPLLSKNRKIFNPKTLNRFRRYGEEKLGEGYDAVVMAHSHMADIQKHMINGKTGTYMNTGDLIGASSYGVYATETAFTLETYDPGPLSVAEPDGR
jgi:UDP-2,3-diacylglucosamine hydrolase